MNREDIEEWANICVEFVYNDLGYTKEQVLHIVVRLDEKNTMYSLCSYSIS